MNSFEYTPMFPMGKDETSYRLLSDSHVSTIEVDGQQFLRVDPEGLTLLAEQAFKDVAHYYRIAHLEQLKAILDDPEASANDRFVALEMLRNAVIAAEGEFPMCQGHRHRRYHRQKGPTGHFRRQG